MASPDTVMGKRIISGVTWAFSPDWLTVEEACYLSGHDPGAMARLIEAGGVDTDPAGLIDKVSLWELVEAEALVAHWTA